MTPNDPFAPMVRLANTVAGSPSGSFVSTLFQNPDFAAIFSGLFKTAIAAGAILAVLRLGYAGFMYMTSDIWSKKDQAKKILQDTVLGLALLLAVWVILFQINPNILNLDIFKVPTENAAKSAPANTNSGVADPASP